MKYSQMVGKTKKEIPSEEESINAKLLIRGGFVQKQMAGVYSFLPLGLTVLQKIITIIRNEINLLGANEILMGALQSKAIFEQSNRWSDEIVDIWFKTKLKNGTEAGLGFSHEEPLVEILRQEVNSYKDLPIAAYQFQNKFRNELRAKGGLLRTREFIMKDMYSFHTSEEDMNNFYEKAKQAYLNIWEQLGIQNETYLTFASGGVFSKYSHEFQTLCESGEDIVYVDKKKKVAINKEVYTDEIIKELGLVKEELEEIKSIEVGNIFKLGTKFSKSGNLKYTTKDGNIENPLMGCYGIGPARVLATVVETYHDEKGIIWPEAIAPYKIHLIGLNLEKEEILNKAESIYKELTSKGYEVLFDDRKDLNAGQKFSDADLLGCPYRVVVSAKTGDQIEMKKRTETESKLVSVEELIKVMGN